MGAITSVGVKVYKILILTSVLAKIYRLLKKIKNKTYYNNYLYMHGYCSRANDFFILFFCLPLHHALLLCLFSQQNHKITHTPPSTTDLYLLPTTKSQNHPCSASTTDQGDTTQIQKKTKN